VHRMTSFELVGSEVLEHVECQPAVAAKVGRQYVCHMHILCGDLYGSAHGVHIPVFSISSLLHGAVATEGLPSAAREPPGGFQAGIP
jgi:hypothetical protein